MELNKLIVKYVNQKEKKPRKVGRYWASDLYNILTGSLKPEDFFKEKRFTLRDCKNITEGELRELGLKTILDGCGVKYKYQVKKKYEGEDFEIVVVNDFEFEDKILETKSPNIISGIREWHKPQLEAQYRVFKKDVYIGFIKERWEHKIFRYTPSDELWELILKKVRNFHEKLKEVSEGQPT